LPSKNVLVEPVARNTAPAIGLAALTVAAKDPEGILVVLPSDHHVANVPGFQAALKEAAELAKDGRLVTLGIRPLRPETGYGYIQRGEPLDGGGYDVKAFKEKPDVETARSYVASGEYFWNAGIFVFQAKAMLAAIAEHAKELSAGLGVIAKAKKSQAQKVLARVFPKLPNISIDYAVMEKASNIAVLPGDFGWSDVGSFAALEEVRMADEHGNIMVGKGAVVVDSAGCVVLAKDRPLAVVGMRDAIIVDSGDAVLVVPKAQSQDVRKAVEALKARRLERYL
jgi:mannose-1-phosphate guanylyltransferase